MLGPCTFFTTSPFDWKSKTILSTFDDKRNVWACYFFHSAFLWIFPTTTPRPSSVLLKGQRLTKKKNKNKKKKTTRSCSCFFNEISNSDLFNSALKLFGLRWLSKSNFQHSSKGISCALVYRIKSCICFKMHW